MQSASLQTGQGSVYACFPKRDCTQLHQETKVNNGEQPLTCARSLNALDSREHFAALPSPGSPPVAVFLPGVGMLSGTGALLRLLLSASTLRSLQKQVPPNKKQKKIPASAPAAALAQCSGCCCPPARYASCIATAFCMSKKINGQES